MKKEVKKGFTLAEIMIVLSVIGVLAGILVPIANSARPDKNVMKFKKADTTLRQVIRELVNSDKYYADGDLGKMVDGKYVTSATYFCETFADIVSTKSVNCSNYSSPDAQGDHMHLGWIQTRPTTLDALKIELDDYCKTYTGAGEEIVLSDKTVFYQTSPAKHFGTARDTWCGLFSNTNCNGSEFSAFDEVYKPVCLDIDGIPSDGSANCDDKKDICPFGYGIRADGKILPGKRANEWLEKDFQQGKKKEEEEDDD